MVMELIENRFFINEKPGHVESIGDYHIMQSETRKFALGGQIFAYHVNEYPDGRKEAVVAPLLDSIIRPNGSGKAYLLYKSVSEDMEERAKEETRKRENISEIHFRKPAESAM